MSLGEWQKYLDSVKENFQNDGAPQETALDMPALKELDRNCDFALSEMNRLEKKFTTITSVSNFWYLDRGRELVSNVKNENAVQMMVIAYSAHLKEIADDMIQSLFNSSLMKIRENTLYYLRILTEKTIRRVIIKKKNVKKVVDQVKNLTRKFPLISMKLLDQEKLLLIFENDKDCKQFLIDIHHKIKDIKVFEEGSQSVEIVIDNVGNMLANDLQDEIEKTTGEKPEILRMVEVKKRQKWRAHVMLTGFAMIKLQADNDSVIPIGKMKSRYKQVPEQVKEFGFGREPSYWMKQLSAFKFRK